jgi:hypothetical protein
MNRIVSSAYWSTDNPPISAGFHEGCMEKKLDEVESD